MQELNEDGLIPGQPVDFETIRRIESERRNKQPEPVLPVEEAPQPTKGRRNAKKDVAAD